MRFEIPEKKKLVHEMTFPVRWGDMDVAGHVNNVMYFRYLESLRLDWLNLEGLLPDPQGEGPLIVNAFCSYMKQLTFPDIVRAKLYITAPGRSSLDTYATLERVDAPGVIRAAGGATIVWVNFPKEQAVPIPEEFRNKLLQGQ
ncbi:MAG: acyl-CoA thioesterase [Burkholderiaceae bacterium]|nr:acyl-CoA thioesterase [Burkholderiaceae bacterium]